MILEQLISPDSVLCNAHARSKKHSLEILSELLANPNPDIANEEIFAKLIERERLGFLLRACALQSTLSGLISCSKIMNDARDTNKRNFG